MTNETDKQPPCNCSTWARDFSECAKNKLPPSNHHPKCDRYVLEEFIRVKHNGSILITELHEVNHLIEWSQAGDIYEIEKVEMTRDQYENLNEFQGF